MSTDWRDPRRRVMELQAELRRLRARAERWGAAETAAALRLVGWGDADGTG